MPVWVLVTASLLQLFPELRGIWMVEPGRSAPVFVEYGLFVQWFRGGAIAALFLGLASPLLGVALLVATSAGAWGRVRGRAEVARFEAEVGVAPLDVEIVVRKRRKGAREEAIPVRVVAASPLRRLLAKGVDGAMLLAAAGTGATFGIFGTVGTLDWGAVAFGWPAVGALVAMGVLTAFQWAGIADRGQTIGKLTFDVREIRGEDGPPSLRQLALRDVAPGVIGFALAVGFAWGAASLSAPLVDAFDVGSLLLLDVLWWVVAWLALPVGWTALALARGVPLLFGAERALHDRVAGTRVVRTHLGDAAQPVGRAPLGPRLVARALDGSLVALAVGIPGGIGLAAIGEVTVGPPLFAVCALALGVGGAVEIGQFALLARTGATLGKRALGLRVQRIDGRALGVWDGVIVRELVGLRGLWGLLPGVAPLADALFALTDARLALHDRVADTEVVYAGTDEPVQPDAASG